MATRDELEAAITNAIAPATIGYVTGLHEGLRYSLSDGRQIVVDRDRVKAADAAALAAYVAGLLE